VLAAELCEGVEGAMVGAGEAFDVPGDGFGVAQGVGQGGDDGIVDGAAGEAGEDGGFDGFHALEAPEGGGLLNIDEFDAIGGLETGDVGVDRRLEFSRILSAN
jgi:hypothetical protein